jgi:hypothetical protein
MFVVSLLSSFLFPLIYLLLIKEAFDVDDDDDDDDDEIENENFE